MADTEVLNRMTLEILAGLEWGDPRSRVPPTEENRGLWEELAAEIADMEARGIGVELPNEISDLD